MPTIVTHYPRLSAVAYNLFRQKADDGMYGNRAFTRFMNDLAENEFGCKPELRRKRVNFPTGKIYPIALSEKALANLEDYVTMFGLHEADDVLNSIPTEYVFPVVWPHMYQVLLDHNIPIPNVNQQMKDLAPAPKIYFLTLKAASEFDSHTINSWAVGQLQFIDTRPPDVKAMHDLMDELDEKYLWRPDTAGVHPVNLRLEHGTLSYLNNIAATYNIHASLRDTQISLAAAVINAVAEGYLTLAS